MCTSNRGYKPSVNRGVVTPPAERGPVYRQFDASVQGLRRVLRVAPALLIGSRVSIDGVHDHHHLVVEATTTNDERVSLLVYARGWAPLSALPSVETGTDAAGRPVRFDFSTVGDYTARFLRLSAADRRMIVAALLERYLGPPI